LDWSKDPEHSGLLSDMLSIVTDAGKLLIWDSANQNTVTSIETGWKGLSFGKWSYYGNILAIGNVKGNLLLWNRKTSRKTPILQKHTKAIIDACWSQISSCNYLALVSDDGYYSVNSPEGF
jgi:WD repeat-containing protein 19